ncbi:MAG: phosphoglucosamine mutase [Solobacterium sp.]|nr:phosphoglucosamine mutase [Solobacterium sp.]
MGKYFGTDGIRGKANETLTAERAFVVGRYLGWYFSQNGKQKIVIGKDTRLSSEMLEAALAAGIAAEGCDAYLTGHCPTPMISYLVQNEDFACGAMISASHNPFYDNGIKIFSKEGIKMPSDVEDLIEEYIDGKVEIPYKTGEEIGKVVSYPEGLEAYLNWIEKSIAVDLTGMSLLVDCANGSASVSAKRALEALGATCTMLNDTPDGVNINTKCGSTHPEILQEKMKEGNYDLGLAFDGDADRMIMVNPEGNLITGDDVLYVSGKYFRDRGLLNNNKVVTTVMANLGLFKALEKEGIEIVSTQVGDKYVFDKMCEEEDIVGGEQSGHIIFKELEKTGDGLVTALMFLKMMKEEDKDAIALCEGLKIYPQLLVNVKVQDKDVAMNDADVKAAIEEVNQRLNGNGRLLVRPSGTEPLVRVMAEAETDEICAEEVGRVVNVVKEKYGVD